MALGSTQPLTDMSTRNLPGGKGRPARGADNLTAICGPIIYKMWEPRRLTTLTAFTACYRDSFAFSYVHILSNSSFTRHPSSEEELTSMESVTLLRHCPIMWSSSLLYVMMSFGSNDTSSSYSVAK
jgi:hypothetical protein